MAGDAPQTCDGFPIRSYTCAPLTFNYHKYHSLQRDRLLRLWDQQCWSPSHCWINAPLSAQICQIYATITGTFCYFRCRFAKSKTLDCQIACRPTNSTVYFLAAPQLTLSCCTPLSMCCFNDSVVKDWSQSWSQILGLFIF